MSGLVHGIVLWVLDFTSHIVLAVHLEAHTAHLQVDASGYNMANVQNFGNEKLLKKAFGKINVWDGYMVLTPILKATAMTAADQEPSSSSSGSIS